MRALTLTACLLALMVVAPRGQSGPISWGLWANPAANPAITTFAAYQNDTAGWLAAYTRVTSAGANHHNGMFQWSDISPTTAEFSWTFVARLVTQTDPKPLMINIALINSDGLRHIPSDLSALAWDHATLIGAFKTFLTALRAQVGNRLVVLTIGNELDFYFVANPSQIAPYATFLAAVHAHAHTLWTHADFRVTTAWRAQALPDWSDYTAIIAASDYIDFTIYDFSDLDQTFTDIVAAVGLGNPFGIQEIGVSVVSSVTQADQRDLAVFAFSFLNYYAGWSLQHATWFGLSDYDDAVLIDAAIMEPTLSFYRYLGVRDEADAPKLIWNTLVKEFTLRPPTRLRIIAEE